MSGESEHSALQLAMTEQDEMLILKIAGMAAVEVAGQLSRALQEAAARSPKILVVDLSDLNFISSTGLGALVAAHVTCQRNGSRLCLLKPREFIQEILEVTRLSTLFEVCESLEKVRETGKSSIR
jgi:anti-sigma B factor antagonist